MHRVPSLLLRCGNSTQQTQQLLFRHTNSQTRDGGSSLLAASTVVRHRDSTFVPDRSLHCTADNRNRRPGFFQNVIENLKSEYEKNKEMQVSEF